jgi:hypothetical protein
MSQQLPQNNQFKSFVSTDKGTTSTGSCVNCFFCVLSGYAQLVSRHASWPKDSQSRAGMLDRLLPLPHRVTDRDAGPRQLVAQSEEWFQDLAFKFFAKNRATHGDVQAVLEVVAKKEPVESLAALMAHKRWNHASMNVDVVATHCKNAHGLMSRESFAADEKAIDDNAALSDRERAAAKDELNSKVAQQARFYELAKALAPECKNQMLDFFKAQTSKVDAAPEPSALRQPTILQLARHGDGTAREQLQNAIVGLFAKNFYAFSNIEQPL